MRFLIKFAAFAIVVIGVMLGCVPNGDACHGKHRGRLLTRMHERRAERLHRRADHHAMRAGCATIVMPPPATFEHVPPKTEKLPEPKKVEKK